PIRAIVPDASGNRIYVGGEFTTARAVAVNGLMVTNGNGVQLTSPFAATALGQRVDSLALSPDGTRLYAGGAFSTIGGAGRRFLAAMDSASGAVDTAFDARAAATVHAVSTSPGGSQIFAGGEFTSVNGVARLNVAALDGNGVLDPGFVADTDGEVDALTADGGQLYIGGTFLHVNGTSEVRLARLNATNGAVDTSFRASPSAAVNALALSSNRLFVGGAFISISGVPRNNLASLNTAAGAVEGWNPNVDSNVADLQLSPDQATVYIAGDFGHVGGLNRPMAAAVDAATGLPTPWKPTPTALVVKLAVSGDGSKVFLAERGSYKDGNRLQAWNTAGTGSLAWEHRADGDFQAVAVSFSLVYAGGHFTTVEGQAHLHLVAFDAGTGAIQSWPPFVSGGHAHGVFDIEVTASAVTVAGDFERSGNGDPANPVTVVAQGITRFANSADPPPTTTTLPPGVTPTTTTTAPGATTTTAPTTTTTQPGGGDPGVGTAGNKAGYWMVGSDGAVYNFGDAGQYGGAVPAAGSSAVDLEPTPSGRGYWIVTDKGVVTTRGDAGYFGAPAAGTFQSGETVTSLSATPAGLGYWIFTSRGRVINFGDAAFYGDMAKVTLNGPVLDSIPTTSGHGYYMVASDGGIFAFGDAKFYGSMGGRKLNAPVQSLVPDGDGVGYWLVASDGGIFAFQAPFKGSMGATLLNKPVTGMVRFADGYLMVGEDGGIFDFSGKPFLGSLGGNPPAHPIVSVAALG
ncbi:MAG TPA: delta-60 repeat domain-containing protein, partial [Acidimicrobiia bacterium]|nr:delta-60 repeat domain-containing protein [Acidimicrobiia bacterium]